MLDVRCSPSSPPQDSALSTQDSRSFGNGQSSPPEPRTPSPEPSRCSPRRIAANRRNARKSTGPRTPAGKRRVSQNALKHGLAATYSHLPSECPATFNTFLHELREELHPVTVMQQYLFDQIANLIWRLRRLPEAQSNLFTEELQKIDRDDEATSVAGAADPASPSSTPLGNGQSAIGNPTSSSPEPRTLNPEPSLTAAHLLARRFSSDPSNGFILLGRYERSMQNALLRLLTRYDNLKKHHPVPTQPDPNNPGNRFPKEPAWDQRKQQEQEQHFADHKPSPKQRAQIDAFNLAVLEQYIEEKQSHSNPPQNPVSTPKTKIPPHTPPPRPAKQSHRNED